MKPPAIPVPVAFVINKGLRNWQGGVNYYCSLLSAIEQYSLSTLQPIVFSDSEKSLDSLCLPRSVKRVYSSAFSSRSPLSLLDSLTARLFGTRVISSLIMIAHGVKVYSHGSPCRLAAIKTIAWIPDFQHIHLPHLFSQSEISRRNKQFCELLRGCDLVIVSSNSAAKDLRNFSPRHANKARVLRFCPNPPKIDKEAIDLPSTLYKLNRPYFYIPNQLWVHKNHLTALRALAIALDTRDDLMCVCSGSLLDYRNPTFLQEFKDEICALGLQDRFLLLGEIPYPHVYPLMYHSVAVINPSLFEGWSTCVEEAKAIGAPLILSAIDVHVEQCEGYNAMYFQPTDVYSLANHMIRIVENADLDSDSRSRLRSASSSYAHSRQKFAIDYSAIVADLSRSS